MSATTFYTIRAGTGLMIKSFEDVKKKRALSKSVITLSHYMCIRGKITYFIYLLFLNILSHIKKIV